MPSNVQNFAASEPALPGRWATEVGPMLADGEKTQAWLELDLDQRLQFASGVVIVTDRRLLARAPDEAGWREWPRMEAIFLDWKDSWPVRTEVMHDLTKLVIPPGIGGIQITGR
jgi:ATP-binding cassette subfamily B protein